MFKVTGRITLYYENLINEMKGNIFPAGNESTKKIFSNHFSNNIHDTGLKDF